MARLGVTIDRRFIARLPDAQQPARIGPRATIGANVSVRRPAFLSPLYLKAMGVLTTIAIVAMSIAIWKLMHYPK